ncbi:uncharacterized protein PHACADRAFT_257986 [Phanerochaete carnosa HHB-10118-sp]|uniref:Uncharacterized protein n=1 Tax=Phanerochaete carnosa (strain HHB-10118-sp) TaxID=650164 RepID=K5W553_PHACS|nr:uncharacterized protein PHACADRAFT_257986 [Phanerochaete carnosa HHB-10118-sp]EKM54260.1 hypothetical protein PHACADRAFT_257986 [Phanerochaete carnosa HHB-10118-sp]
MFSLISRSKTRLNKSDVQLPAKQEPDVAGVVAVLTAEPEQTQTTPALELSAAPVDASLQPQAEDARPSASIYSSDEPQDAPTDDTPTSTPTSEAPQDVEPELESKPQPPVIQHRFSFRPLTFKFLNGQLPSHEHSKPILSAAEEHKKKLQASEDRTRRITRISYADKRAKESAIVARSLIIGPAGITLPKPKPLSKPKIDKVKSQLLQPKSANRVIAQLRALSTESVHVDGGAAAVGPAPPIRAVCLKVTDTEVDARHFTHAAGVASVFSASVAQLSDIFSKMELVDLVTAANLGLGASADEPGLFSGAVPTAGTIIEGIEKATPQLMALGYATGKVVQPDHTGIYPPTDRMSVITYWWGLEIVLPPSSIAWLGGVPSVAHSVINVLTALAVLNGGVAEIMPFVRYIATYIDAEFKMIQGQDRGKGVVCAATWLLPAALVPRPWDFAPAPPVQVPSAPIENPAIPTHDKPANPDVPTSPISPSEELSESRPASPPALLPPLNIHSSSFNEPDVNTAPPVDNTLVVSAEKAPEAPEASNESELPAVAVVPPTPTSVQTTTSHETVTAV